ncbi:thylakoid soluble phosphoprotein [Trifolium repens]|nr:thylakoid soluble phosphoprotein [Trifolium repens]
MASMTMLSIVPTPRRVFAARATKGTTGGGGGSIKEEKGLWDFILGSLTKQDQFYETDPILKKVEEEKSGTRGTTTRGGTTNGGKNSVAVPQKKKGGFGGLFAKN